MIVIDALLCEFEGVLADTGALRRRALRHALADEGLALGDRDAAACSDGLAVEPAVRAALAALGVPRDDTGVALLAMRAARHFTALTSKGLSLVSGAREFLDRARGVTRLALVTRATRREVDYVLALAELDAVFECIVAAEDAPETPPEPDGYRIALERMSRRRPVRRDRTIALVDAPPAARAAHAAGIRAAIVGGHPGGAAGADAVTRSLADLSLDELAPLLASRKETVG